ncbi:MAG: YggT family protein [Deltaproteobacteria bacterium]|jgi:YggT family protein|nr:YggT family protein [Deltaproteobacteria bacterium]
MFVLANILGAIATILHGLIFVYTWIIIIAALLSFVRPDPYNPIVRMLHALTQPLQWRVRRWLPFVMMGGLDLSPLVIIMALQFVDYALVASLAEWAVRMRMGS